MMAIRPTPLDNQQYQVTGTRRPAEPSSSYLIGKERLAETFCISQQDVDYR